MEAQMLRIPRHPYSEVSPVAGAWIVCLMIAALALAWSGVR
jgi:hypothetical protein